MSTGSTSVIFVVAINAPMNFQPLLISNSRYFRVLFIYSPLVLSPLLRLQTMNFRSEKHITKSNGFSLPLSRVLGHPHIVVLRFADAAPWLKDRTGVVVC